MHHSVTVLLDAEIRFGTKMLFEARDFGRCYCSSFRSNPGDKWNRNEGEHSDCRPDISDRPETYMVNGDATNDRTGPDTRIGH